MSKGKFEYWLTDDGLMLLEAWTRDGYTDEQIAKKMNIAYSTFRLWRDKFSAMSAVLKKNKELVDIEVENALLKRALGYRYTEITKERIVDTAQKKRHGGQIELTEKEWDIIKAYFGYSCCYCGKPDNDLTRDHLNPLANGGNFVIDNVVPCCGSCNSSKKDNEWLSWFQRQQFYDKKRAEKVNDFVEFAISIKNNLNNDIGEMVITKEVTKEVSPDVGAMAFWLKNRKKKEWKDKPVEIEGAIEDLNQNLIDLSELIRNPVDNRKLPDE